MEVKALVWELDQQITCPQHCHTPHKMESLGNLAVLPVHLITIQTEEFCSDKLQAETCFSTSSFFYHFTVLRMTFILDMI